MAQQLWKKSLAVSYKAKRVYQMTQELHSWAFIPGEGKLGFTENRYKDVHSSFICKSPNWE